MSPVEPIAAPTLALTQEDSWLQPYEPILLARQQRLAERLAAITQEYGSLSKFATAHQRLGLHYDTAPPRLRGARVGPRRGGREPGRRLQLLEPGG